MSDMEQVLQAILELSSKMDHQYQTLSARIDGLTERVDVLTNKVDVLTERVDSLTVSHAQLSEKVDHNHQTLLEKIDQINEKIGLLAEDSVSTRADVRGLKKAIKMNS